MIKAEELMIGDWVLDGTKYAQVTSITCDGIIETTVNKKSNIELLEPIPITHEILEKNGFRLKEESDLHKKYIAGDELCIIVFYFYKETIYGVSTLLKCERGFAGGLDQIHKCNLLYVHQLQHALKLCGITKNIEL